MELTDCKPYLLESVVGDKWNLGSFLSMVVFLGVVGLWLFSAKGMVTTFLGWFGVIKKEQQVQVVQAAIPTGQSLEFVSVNTQDIVEEKIIPGTFLKDDIVTIEIMTPTVTASPTIVLIDKQEPTKVLSQTPVRTATIRVTFYIPLPKKTEEPKYATQVQPTKYPEQPTYTPRSTFTAYPTGTRYPTATLTFTATGSYTPTPSSTGTPSCTATQTATQTGTMTPTVHNWLPFVISHYLPYICRGCAPPVTRHTATPSLSTYP